MVFFEMSSSKKTMPFTQLIKVNAWSLLTKILQFYFLFERKKKHYDSKQVYVYKWLHSKK